MKVTPFYFWVLGIIFIISTSFISIPDKEPIVFPEPKGIDNLLFYVQRTINTNTIIYELNLKNGELNEAEPIKTYWIKYADKSKIEDLSFIQRKLAYGIKSKLIDKAKGVYSFHFVSYEKKELYLIKSKTDNKFKVFVLVNGEFAQLKNIHIQIDGGTFWVPNVKYVLIKAVKPDNNQEIIEKIIP